MRSILNGINRANKKDRTTYKEDGKAKDTQSEWQEKRSQNYNNNLRSLWDTSRCKNSCVIGVPKEKQEVEELFEEIIMENFPRLMKEINT